MPVQLSMTVTGADRLQRGLSNAPKTVADETRSAMTAALLLLEADQKANAPQDTRRLMGSIHHTITGSGGDLTGKVGPSVRYAYWVEHGRAAGRQPPVDAISGWARRHGVNPYVLARAIGRHGTRAQPFVRPSLTRNRGKVISMFDKVGAKVAARVVGG